MTPASVQGAVLGAGLAVAGSVLGVALVRWGFGKDSKRFFAALVAAILGRLFLFGAALVFVALETAIDVTATAVSLLAAYVVLQVVEVRLAVGALKKRRV